MMKILKLAILLMASTFAFAEVPQLINYQGVLTDAQGNPKLGTANLLFEIYDGVSSTNKLWGPQTFSSVPLINGMFNVILGSTDANGSPIANAFSTPNSYLQITDLGATASSSDDTIISPRQQVLSSPYALHAAKADTADIASDVPYLKSAVIAFHTTTCPSGWSELPSLYGRFIRGVDKSGQNFDPDGQRSIGSIQNDEYKSHSHGYSKISGDSRAGTGSNNFNAPSLQSGETVKTTSNNGGGSETRPKNVSLLYCVKN